VTGYDTLFLKEVNPGDQIAVSGDSGVPTVKKVISNTELLLDRPFVKAIPREGRSYKVCLPLILCFDFLSSSSSSYIPIHGCRSWRRSTKMRCSLQFTRL
jgi:hypothetical protein